MPLEPSDVKWIVVFGIVVAAAIALTGIDKYDEKGCKDRRAEHPSISTIRLSGSCDGFLPW